MSLNGDTLTTADGLRKELDRCRCLIDLVAYTYTVRLKVGVPVETIHDPGCVVITGYTPEELMADPGLWYRMIHEDDRPSVTDEFLRLLSGEDVGPIEHRIWNKKGEIRWIKNSPVVRRGNDGSIVSYDGLIEDISDRKRMEEELRESEERFRRVFDTASDGMLVADVDSMRFIMANAAICRMLGYTREELFGMGVSDIHPKKDLPFVREQFERQARREFGVAESLPVLRKDGSIFYADISSTPVAIGGRNCLSGIFRDITERKEMMERDRQLIDDLEKMNRIMVDRELRIRELRDENERLKARVDQLERAGQG